jgi:predicted nucleotidyltransferase
MNVPIDLAKHTNLPWLSHSVHLLTKHGSHAYGLNTATSDLDIKGIAIPPRRYFTGFVNRFEQAETHDPDLTIYDIRKFFALAADCNPNIIEILWTAPDCHLYVSPIGEQIIACRDWFLSRKAKYTFSGYAIAQLKRIKTHRRWLLQPPDHQPTRDEFGLPEQRLMSADEQGAIAAVLERPASTTLIPVHAMAIYEKERAYGNAAREWVQYLNWKATRNPARAAIEAEHGYDCKHAMHLVRLMRMCREILTTGTVVVQRPDRDELLAIRNGAWDYDQLITWAEQQDKDMAALLDVSPLPHSPNRQALDLLCSELVERSVFSKEAEMNTSGAQAASAY